MKDNGLRTWLKLMAAPIVALVLMAPAGQASGNDENSVDHANSLGMKFMLLQSGSFMMGSPDDEAGRYSDENLHRVTLTHPFYLQTTEVTQKQWETVMGENPANFTGCPDCPVERTNWYDVEKFIAALNKMGEGVYRLPTEAEWEYAARAGSSTALPNGDLQAVSCEEDKNLDALGWYCFNSKNTTQPVAQKQPNSWGFYDMHGNAWEWVSDWYGPMSDEDAIDPKGPATGERKVKKGGSWSFLARDLRSANRDSKPADDRCVGMGFRLVMEP